MSCRSPIISYTYIEIDQFGMPVTWESMVYLEEKQLLHRQMA